MPSWITRGSPAEVIEPKPGEANTAFGNPSGGVFVRLKASTRNSSNVPCRRDCASVGPELGQTVRKGQTLAVVSSNDLADAQSKCLSVVAELDEHHKHHARTEKLVEIGAASREELEMAASKLKAAESEVPNLRQRLLLLGLSLSTAQRAAFSITD